MKKIIAIFLCINFVSFNASFAFEDELAAALDKNLKIQKEQMPYYEDDTAKNLDANLRINYTAAEPIYDTFAQKTLNPNLKIVPVSYSAIVNDMPPKADKITYIKGSKDDKYDFSSLERTIVKISPVKYITTKTDCRKVTL